MRRARSSSSMVARSSWPMRSASGRAPGSRTTAVMPPPLRCSTMSRPPTAPRMTVAVSPTRRSATLIPSRSSARNPTEPASSPSREAAATVPLAQRKPAVEAQDGLGELGRQLRQPLVGELLGALRSGPDGRAREQGDERREPERPDADEALDRSVAVRQQPGCPSPEQRRARSPVLRIGREGDDGKADGGDEGPARVGSEPCRGGRNEDDEDERLGQHEHGDGREACRGGVADDDRVAGERRRGEHPGGTRHRDRDRWSAGENANGRSGEGSPGARLEELTDTAGSQALDESREGGERRSDEEHGREDRLDPAQARIGDVQRRRCREERDHAEKHGAGQQPDDAPREARRAGSFHAESVWPRAERANGTNDAGWHTRPMSTRPAPVMSRTAFLAATDELIAEGVRSDERARLGALPGLDPALGSAARVGVGTDGPLPPGMAQRRARQRAAGLRAGHRGHAPIHRRGRRREAGRPAYDEGRRRAAGMDPAVRRWRQRPRRTGEPRDRTGRPGRRPGASRRRELRLRRRVRPGARRRAHDAAPGRHARGGGHAGRGSRTPTSAAFARRS